MIRNFVIVLLIFTFAAMAAELAYVTAIAYARYVCIEKGPHFVYTPEHGCVWVKP